MLKKIFQMCSTVLAVGLIAGGCVSKGTFKKMAEEKNQEIATLQQQNAALASDKADLQKDMTADRQKIADLEEKNTAAAQEKNALLAANAQRQQQYEKLVLGLADEVKKGQLQVRQYQNMLAVDLAEQIFFDSGRATLKKEGRKVLKKVAGALKWYENKVIRVVGHTDNVPVAKSLRTTFPSNWELSVARATNVVRFLQEAGIPPERMVASGHGEYDPVASNDTAEGRQKNRRIEIMLIDQSLASELSR